jgi:CHAT domain-containing protein
VVVVTSDRASAFRVPDWSRMRDRIRVFLGFCRRRDGSETGPAARLFDDLLAEPLGALNPSVKRLIIIPDVYLHWLPFAALRPEPDGEPLGATHEISQVPSIRLWLRWRDEQRSAPDRRPEPAVLAFADPETGIATGDSGLRAGEPWIEGLRLGPLPHAREEARTVVRNVGGASRALIGAAASESSLKSADLRAFGILHFAAHAVLDPRRPERSAIFLAPGKTDEDGFLQPREIADMDLDDKLVLLSSCRSASGMLLPGEGMLGLARAFFQAGAHAVVGNLWPMRDDEARVLMSELSEQLADGKSLSASVTAVRAARIRAGAPTDAWAGLVVLGDGDMVPVPGGTRKSPIPRGWTLAGIALVVMAAGAALAIRRLTR